MLHSRRRTFVTQRMLGEGEAEMFAPGRAPCVVAFHGFGGTASELRPLLDRIAQAGRAVDAALLVGHGTHAIELQEVTFDGWVDAARARTQAAVREHGRVILLGFSLGSLVAMQIASEAPYDGTDGVVGLVAMGNALTLQPHTSLPLGLVDRLGWRMPDVYLLKPRAGDLVDKAAMGLLVTYDRHPMRAALEVYRAGARVRAVVGSIRCPTLVLHGRKDLVCSWRNAAWLGDHVGAADVTVRVFERSGHVIACDGEREDVAREVIAFAERL
jgi:carboxylesterase